LDEWGDNVGRKKEIDGMTKGISVVMFCLMIIGLIYTVKLVRGLF